MATQRSTVDQVRESLRLQQVYNVFMRYGMDLLFDRTVMGDFRRTMQRWVYVIDHPLEALSVPVKIRLMLQELGPTYVKMGQIVSSRADVLPPDWAEEMDKLQSDVPPFPYENVVEIKKGKKEIVSKILMPGYVLVNMNEDGELFSLINKLPGVAGFVGDGTDPIALSEKEVEHIFTQVEDKQEGKQYDPRFSPSLPTMVSPGHRCLSSATLPFVSGPAPGWHGRSHDPRGRSGRRSPPR